MSDADNPLQLIPDPQREYGSWILGEELPHGRTMEVVAFIDNVKR